MGRQKDEKRTFKTIRPRKGQAKSRVAVGIPPHGSHRSGLARLRHPARHVTVSLRLETPAHPATAVRRLVTDRGTAATKTAHAASDATATSATDTRLRSESVAGYSC